MKTHHRTLRKLLLGVLAVLAGIGATACSSSRSLSYEQMRQEYDPDLDGYNYADEMHTATLAQTGSKWPFNNTPTTIALAQLRESTNYGVEVTVLAYSGGRLGNIRVTDRARNGFKLVHDGSATTVKVQIRVTGGMTDPAPTE